MDAYADLMRFRAVIEPAALRDKRFNLSALNLQNLCERALDVLDKGMDNYAAPDLFRFGCEFHETLVEASSNQLALEMLKRLNAQRRLFVYRVRNDDRLRSDIQEHLVILDMIENKNMKHQQTNCVYICFRMIYNNKILPIK